MEICWVTYQQSYHIFLSAGRSSVDSELVAKPFREKRAGKAGRIIQHELHGFSDVETQHLTQVIAHLRKT